MNIIDIESNSYNKEFNESYEYFDCNFDNEYSFQVENDENTIQYNQRGDY